MNKLIVSLIAGAFASVAVAQTAPPKPTKEERREDVKATTQQGAGSSASTQATAAQQSANVKASKEVDKMTKEEKAALAREINKSTVNPDNPTGGSGTATRQKSTTAASKAVPKDRPNINTPEAQKALQKASTP